MKGDDSLFIERTLAGDSEAFRHLVERYRGSVFALALHFAGDFHDASDLAQEAFIKAYRRLSTLKDKDRFGSWLLKIAANECRMRARKRSPRFVEINRLESDDPDAASEFLAYSEPEFSNLELRELLEKAIDVLTPSEQEVYTLYFIDHHTYRQIAAVLEVPMGTVKRRLHNIRQKMRKEILLMTSKHGILKHSIGLETFTDKARTRKICSPLIHKGTPLPASHSQIFTTADDNQASIDVHLLEGDGEDLDKCCSLGRIRVRDFSIAPKWVPQIELVLDIDVNGMLTVSAKERPSKMLVADWKKPIQVSVEK